MENLSSVAAKMVELTVELIGRQVGYLLCYGNNFKELNKQLEDLRTTKERIDREIEGARRNGEEIESDVKSWHGCVIDALDEAKRLCEDPRDANARCSKWFFPNLKSRHQRSRKAMKMANTIVELKGKGNFDKGVGYVSPLDITNNFSTARGSDELRSRNSVKADIVLSVKDPKVSKIGVYGIGGVGKTTLVKEVAKQVKVDKLFDEVVMVTMSQSNLEKIQDEIAEQLGLHLEEKTSSIGRANRLCERIKKEKTILIILDDLREKIDLDKLGIPFLDASEKNNSEKVGVPLKDDYKGCKLLLTSRTQDILQKNDTQKNFSLQVLNVEESWSLFEAMVGDIVKDDEFRVIATQVAQRCVGLPLLIVTIATSLKSNDIHYWKDTLNNLKGVDNKEKQAILFSALEFNFNRLEDEVKKVILLCGVHGTSILFSDLLKYVIGLGIFKHVNAIEDARDRLYRIILDLKNSCLLVDDDARTEMTKMHDIVLEVANSIALKYAFSKINVKWQDWQRNDIPETCTQIILKHCFIRKLPERLDCPYLTFFHITTNNRDLEIPDSFFEGAGNLEALDLTSMAISSLPISFSLLTKLKTLCLDYCFLKDMSRICALLNLEILSLIGSSIERFPSEIEQLTKLRMLDLSKSGIGTILPNIWCKLTKIEELYMGDASINWEVESSAKQKRNASLAKLGHLTSLTTLELQVREAWPLPKDIPFDKLKRYKVVIGEKWEWLGNEGTSKLLKVKLDTNIHSERWIKTLIESVEDLYLDKIIGFSNVLFRLNGKGFPSLKHLHIQNNGEIQHIIDSVGSNQTHVLFPNLETLLLYNLNNLVNICHGPIRENSFCKLKVLKVKNCDQLVYLFSVSMVKSCSHIAEIQVSECNSMKRMVSIESADRGNSIDEKIEFLTLRSLTLQHLPTIGEFCSHESRVNVPTPFFSAKVKFHNLETLKLSSVNLKNIWDDNQSSVPYFIQNLANLTVEDCSGLKYLFSSSIVGRLSNLKQLEISKCDMMVEIIATEEISGASSGEVLFPKLETILIKDMQNLKTIWHLILASNSLAYFKTLEVKNCDKIEKIFPEYMNGAFASLETLKVEDCKLVKEIFQLGVNVDHTTQLKYITVLHLPQLKQIWSSGSQSSLHFKNLQVVRVEGCGDLEYLFPFSIAKHLPQLEAIIIKNAQRMKEIVFKREDPLDNLVEFEFNRLTSVVLWNLQDLQGFCVGNHSLFCSSLKTLDVFNCQKLKLFKKQDTSSQGRLSDVDLHISTQQPLFTLEEVIDILEHLLLNNEDAKMIFQSQVPRDQFHKLKFLHLSKLEDAQGTSPYWFLQNMSSLEWLVIGGSPFKVIFPHQMPQDENGEIEIKTRLKKLTLLKLDELQHICKEGCQLDPVLDVLEYLVVYGCSNLKHLVPSSVTFNHLTYLEVQNCNGLIYLMTSSTAQSMVKLTTLKIRECDRIERILEEDGRESKSEIEFCVLEVLELEYLPKLNSFGSSNCSLKLPLLEKLVIRQCPRLEAFATSGTSSPLLREILTDEKDGKWFRDLNSTVNEIFQQKVAFRSMERLELSQYPELGDVWYSYVKHGIFGNLKNLVIQKCDFLSKVLLPLNLLKELSRLEELEVRECNSLEALFELPNTNEGGIVEKVTIHLKILNLLGLPELKHIWEQNSREILGFENFGEIPSDNNQGMHTSQIQGCRETTKEGDIHHQPPTYSIAPLKQSWSKYPQESHRFCNLEVVHVEDCDALQYLFPFSIATSLLQLEQITIKKAWKMKEIVSDIEGTLDCPPKFEFNHLSSLVLWSLPELQEFYSKSHSLQCPSLKILDVRSCLKWSLFNKHGTSGRGKVLDANLQGSTQQLTFPLKEVICNLETLALNCEDASEIVQGQLSREQFCKLKCLVFHKFEDEQARFPYWFLQNVISLEEMSVELSSFKEIFQHEGQNGIQTRIKLLTLNKLHELEYICKQGCQIDPVLEVLESIDVDRCSNLKNLVPSSVTFNHLTCLEVQNCRGLIYLITSSTARSLVNLTTMKIRECDLVEEIVAEEGGESINEIVFICLEVLELESLPKLKLFSSSNCFLKLPLLNKLVIKQCPRMKSFAISNTNAPRLKKIQTEGQNGKWCWEGDLNRTVDKIFQDKVAFSSFNDLELSTYPELEELWYGQVGQKTFCNLKHLVVRKCTFLSNVLFSSNLLQLLFTLEELEVVECDSLEVVFDVKALDDKEIESKEVSQLKTLTLSRLPNLKSIWNGEAGEIISYGNLQTVKVDKCQHLKNLFSVSLCQDLRQLEELHIESCGVEEIVLVEEGLEELKFDFPQLTILKLFNLTRLSNFYPKRYALECPSLKQLNIHGCEELQIFEFDPLNAKPLREDDIDLNSIALLYIEKVPQRLEDLTLNEKDAIMILNGNCEKNLFQSIKRLRLQQFQETPIKFLNNLIQIFPAITALQVRWCSFEALFPSKEIGHCNIESPTQIKALWLFQLQKLEHIWNDDTASHPVLQDLEYMYINECPTLIRLAPPSASFKNLTYLAVKDCNGLMYFMTTCTAKSLVHLTSLEVSTCGMLDEVVMTDEGESEDEITFESLEYLELNCLSSFKSVCSGKYTFIFPSLVTLKVIGCHKMQNFSCGVIIAPFLKLVEVENRKKRWMGDLNTTIKHLFMEKAIEEFEGDGESLNINKQSSHIHQSSASTSRALSSKERVHGAKSKADETVYNSAMGTEEMNEDNQAPFTEAVKSTLTNASVQETDRSQDLQLQPSEISLLQTTSTMNDDEPNTGTKEIDETIQRPLVQNAKDMLNPDSVQDIATGIHVTHENIHKPFVQTTEDAWDITIVQKKGESYDSDIHLSKNLFDQSTPFMDADNKEIVGTEEMYETKSTFSVDGVQNPLGLVHDMGIAIDPAPLQASKSESSSAIPATYVCNSFKEVDISVQLLPYFEAGVKRHPQVLDWLNTKRRRVLASSSFSLFAEVTRILRTTRRRHLTEDDQNYIRECCSILQVAGFDASWLSYVYKCIEECDDDREEDIKRKVEETKSQASSLIAQLGSFKKELASMEESLVLLIGKASRMDEFIES